MICQWFGITVNWQIGVRLEDSRFWGHWDLGRNRGFSLVESFECWLLIGREGPLKIFKGVTLKILKLCQSSIFDNNWHSIGINSSLPMAPRVFPSIEGNDRGAIGRDESLLIDIQLAVNWHSIGSQFVLDSIGSQLTFNWQLICIGLEWIHLSPWLLGCFPL